MMEDNPSSQNIKGDNYLCGLRVSFVIWITVTVLLYFRIVSGRLYEFYLVCSYDNVLNIKPDLFK